MENLLENIIEEADANEKEVTDENAAIEGEFAKMRMREEAIKKCFSSEDCRKIQSDSTSLLSDSSDALSESYTDSDSHSLNINRIKIIKSKTSMSFEAEYPTIIKKHNQRSKSQMFKKNYIESVVVNEETVEDEYDIESALRRKPLRFTNVNFNDDLPSKFSKNNSLQDSLKNNNLNSSSRSFKSHSNTTTMITINMDPVQEVKEEERETKRDLLLQSGQILSLNSPRIKYLTDIKEDNTISTPNFLGNSGLYIPRDYSRTVETDEIITEDNNEYLVENELKHKKKESLHKILIENIIDKEENYNMQEINMNSNFEEFETIKEENVEEDDKEIMSHKKSSNVMPLADEVFVDTIHTNFRLPKINDEDEDLIKEIADEEKDENILN